MKALYNAFVSVFLITVIASCTDTDYGKDFDINYPVPVIQSVTEEPMVGQEITIKGIGFASPNTVSINGISMKIVSETETEIKAILPRIFEAAPLVLKNVYMRQWFGRNNYSSKISGNGGNKGTSMADKNY